jgi:hypothetical protein
VNDDRRRLHIGKFGRVFLPQSRMRHVRWEEAVLRSRAKRAGVPDPVIHHTDCHCGSVECLAVPWTPGGY